MKPQTARGVSNNNPGNIRFGDSWEGMAASQVDPSFITFIGPEYGIRAMARILTNYQQWYGINTVGAIVARWAPPEDNNPTADYAQFVAGRLGVAVDEPIDVVAVLDILIPALIFFENGSQPYSRQTIELGVSLA